MQIADRISNLLKVKPGKLYSLPPDGTVYQALELIAGNDIGAVLVMQGAELQGVFSEREYARNVALHGRSSRDTPLSEVMYAPPFTITPNSTVDDAMRIMSDHHIRHLPVMEGSTVIGIVSLGDLVKWIINCHEETIQHLHGYITGQHDISFLHR